MKRAVIYVPGLGDHRLGAQRLVISLWRMYGIRTEIVPMYWYTDEDFDHKLARLLKRIDELDTKGYVVTLVGVSAGASAVINAYAVRQNAIRRIVCLCGALQPSAVTPRKTAGQQHGFNGSRAMLADSLNRLSMAKRAYILSIRPCTDSVVPPENTIIDGAEGRTIPTHGHVRSIALGITVFSLLIIRFIKR